MGANPVLRFRQHASGAAGGIADGHDHAWLGEHLGIRFQQQVHHQLDHLPRREVIPGCFIGCFIETTDKILKHQAHGDVIHRSRMQIDIAELRNYLVEAI